VNQTDDVMSALVGRTQILVNHRDDVARLKRVKVDGLIDRNRNGVFLVHAVAADYW